MAVFKCKMCGGQLEVQENLTVIECEYCGTQQTLPTLDNEKKLNLFNRANRLRMSNEFDKAAGVFESIVAEFPEEAEAYWGLILCKYGIEYVDDPATGKKVPTCHRTSYDSIFDDNNFEMALEYADGVATSVYRSEAKEIDRLQKAILDIASKEEPFDVFICYKETAEDGQRTKDSVMAEDIYDRLTDKGYKVFFARITLEDKLGQEYEPFIFSALNSAKVMLAIGTKYEYYNAVWVKNEWSRFLEMMKKDKEKLLIPCYADIDAYDMPSEFKNLQGQDMNKIGFIQDLIRGIGKVIPLKKEEPVVQSQTVVTQSAEVPLLKRANMFLEDGKFNDAKSYFNKVLDINPECGDAYAGLFLVEKSAESVSKLIRNRKSFVDNAKYESQSIDKADEHIANKVNEYTIPKYLEAGEIQNLYVFKLKYQTKTNVVTGYLNNEYRIWNNEYFDKTKRFNNGEIANTLINAKDEVVNYFKAKLEDAKVEEKNNKETLENNYKEFLVSTDEILASLYNERKSQKAEDERVAAEKLLAKNTATYNEAMTLVKNDDAKSVKEAIDLLALISGFKDSDSKIEEFKKLHESIVTYDKAVGLLNDKDINRANQAKELFVSLGNFRDSNDKVKACDRLISELKAKKKKTNTMIITIVIVAIIAVASFTIGSGIAKKNKYDEANALLNNKQYEEALDLFTSISSYEDSSDKIANLMPNVVDIVLERHDFDKGISLINSYPKYGATENDIKELKYKFAVAKQQYGLYDEAIMLFEELGENYKDVETQIDETNYLRIVDLFEKKDYNSIYTYKEETNGALSLTYKDVSYYYAIAYYNVIGHGNQLGYYLTEYLEEHPNGEHYSEIESIAKEKASEQAKGVRDSIKNKESVYSEYSTYNKTMTEDEVKKLMVGSWDVYYNYSYSKKKYSYISLSLQANGKATVEGKTTKWKTRQAPNTYVYLTAYYASGSSIEFHWFDYIDDNTVHAYSGSGWDAYFIRK